MKAARPTRFERSYPTDPSGPLTRSSDGKSSVASTRAVNEFEIIRNLANWTSVGLGELLIYGMPNNQTKTSP